MVRASTIDPRRTGKPRLEIRGDRRTANETPKESKDRSRADWDAARKKIFKDMWGKITPRDSSWEGK